MVYILIGAFLVAIAVLIQKSRRSILAVFLAGLAGLFIMLGEIEDEPTAMDVYKGKTTLEIIYKDGVAIDSVVVFKDDVK